MISHEALTELLKYDSVSGEFSWLVDRGRIRAGDPAGAIRKDGYLQIMIDHKLYLAHRLAWFYVNGRWATAQVDHINRNRRDNSFANLRLATNKQNGENLPLLCTNSSGYRGVSKDRRSGKWKAQVKHFSKSVFLGNFDSVTDAAEAARAARNKLFSHSNE